MQSYVTMRAVQTLYNRGLKKTKKEPNPGLNVGSNKMPQQRRQRTIGQQIYPFQSGSVYRCKLAAV